MKLSEYNPYGVEMYSHQRETMAAILYYKRLFVLDDIGTGKTMSSLAACDFLMYHNKISKVLIISPISVIRSTWADHILNYFPGRSFTVIHQPTRDKRIANLNLNCNFYIVNTDGIKVIENELIKKEFDLIIIDESTTYSSHTSARTKCAWRLTKKIPAVVCMTGNPIPNDTLQAYAQAKLINFDRPRYFTKFRDQLKIKLDMYTYIDRDNAVDLAYSVLQPAVRHKMEDCLDLPPVIFSTVDIKMTKEQEKHYEIMEKEYLTFLNSGDIVTAANAGVRQFKLMQISAGIIIDDQGEPIGIDHKYRLEELNRIMGQKDQIIIFAMFTHSVNSLVKQIPGAEKIDGSVKSNQRYDIIKRFQNHKLKVLVCQPAAISHGVTLTASNTIIWWSPPYSNDHFIQCNGRIRRPGQTRTQHIIKFQSTRVEKKIFKALEKKQSVSKSLLDLYGE